MTVNGIEITSEIILATRQHFADIYRDCIDGAESGAMRVNDVEGYVAKKLEAISAVLAGEHDACLGFMQRAHYLQTGKSFPLLPF